jgi:xanthine dehydrogenase accessory factor
VINLLERVLELQKRGEEGVLITVVEKEGSGPAGVGSKMLVYADGRTAGTVGGGSLEHLATQKALELLHLRKSLLQRYALSEHNEVIGAESTGMLCGGRVALFYEHLTWGPRVYLFGGGHVGQALAYHLRNLAYYVTVIDQRPGIADAVTGVDRVLIADYDRALEDEHLPQGGFFVIATPSHQADYVILRRIFTSPWKPQYVGLVASKAKAAQFIRDLQAELGRDIDLRVLYSPVGLDIGGSSVDEIAISIIAEMQAVRYGREGHRHMRLEK